MQYRIGKVRNYNQGAGYIITPSKKYLFLTSDLMYEDAKDDDIVIFGDEDKDRAFFVKKLEFKKDSKLKEEKEVN